MCGICGLVDLKDRSTVNIRESVHRMAGRIAHRGPDAEGLWHDPGISLGHRRLSIIDLTGSTQPMIDPTRRYVLIFNGEIYNYLELRAELMDLGVRFVTKGDTEVLLAAFITYGVASLQRLNGMFAFAIWDRETKTLFAARDRMGVKPLFYGLGDGGLFAFASELQALRGLPLDFALRATALTQYLRNGFIRSPNTIFQGIQELRPAHYLNYDHEGLKLERYWEPPLPDHTLAEQSVHEHGEELRHLFRSAVKLRLRSDVPLGAFLSGGLDSSAVVTSMNTLGETAIHTFAIGFDGAGYDESPQARKVAEYFGTKHHETHVTPRAEELLLDLVRHYGQPFGDSSAIPTWHLCKETRQHVTVALSGDGGDELFCGYRRYVARRMLEWYHILPPGIRQGPLLRLIERLPEGTAYYDHSLIKQLKLFISLDKRISRNPHDIYSAYFTTEELTSLLDVPSYDIVQTAEEQTNALEGQGLKTIEQMMLADLLHYLPDDILTKVDRASMAHGLEVRSPFMDYRIVEFAARLPLKYKLRGLTTKYVLRNAFAADLPPEPLKRRKHGFAVPLGDGFHGHLRKTYEDIVFSGGEANLVNRKESERLLSEHLGGRVDHGHRLWLILFLHAWFQWWNNG
jgi:asparagine synthase (glutamine-hydrolysing)